MVYTVSITRQGQISIPAKIRRELGLDKTTKALVSKQNGKIIVEPARDILDLQGVFKTNIKVSPRIARRKFEEYLANRSK